MDEASSNPAAGEPAGPSGLLARHLPEGRLVDPDAALGRFLESVEERGLTLYPAQEEALLELAAGRHVILNTPTGSGKSLVALGLHFQAVCAGQISVYTSPIKALASEKFFALCAEFGPERVGMLTGDASINPSAPVLCCTAEVLANMALRRGDALDIAHVVMDEFHYYSDPERGVAWQIPLLALPRTRFLLMSATLGDVSGIAERLSRRSGREVAIVASEDRPVPLDYEYRDTPLHETVASLLAEGKAPIYIVNFTQRECAELAQALTSMKIAEREQRDRIREAIGDYRLDTPYGKEVRRLLGFGIGIHHAGLLPKYRLLVEQLSQHALLRVICGTDTLGVGVNIPLRTVLFSKLAKFDGRKVVILAVRDFKQISGRAGRKGFDDLGSVVAQAPEHVIEKLRSARRAEGKSRKVVGKGPTKGEVSWSEETFQKLITRPPETLKSRFRLSHGMVLNLLQRDAELNDPSHRNFSSLRELIAESHEEEGAKRRLISFAAELVRSLYRAGVIVMSRDTTRDYRWAVVAPGLQWDFSLHQALALYLVETVMELDPTSETYAFDLITLAEAILENPEVILRRQVDKAKQALIAELKAEGMAYEDRIARLEEVTYPQPLADYLYGTFHRFRSDHPWVGGLDIRPKSIGRELYEGYLSFADYVKHYGLERSEGVLLRYLAQLFKTLDQSVPEGAKTPQVWDAIGYFRALLETTDSSLIEEWESLLHPEAKLVPQPARRGPLWVEELLRDPRIFAARVRGEAHLLVRALSRRDWEAAAAAIRQGPEQATQWDEDRFAEALAPFHAEYGEIVFNAESRRHALTQIRSLSPREWKVSQTLVDPAGDSLWAIEASIDLRASTLDDGPLLVVQAIAP
jgi:hypothetical protein